MDDTSDFGVCFSRLPIKDAFRVWLLLVSTVGALLAQIIGSIYGYLAYREARDEKRWCTEFTVVGS